MIYVVGNDKSIKEIVNGNQKHIFEANVTYS